MSDQIEQIVTALTGCCAECADRAEHIAWAIHEHAPAGLLATPERDAEVWADERAKVLAGFTREDVAPFFGHGHTSPGYWRLVGPKHYKPIPTPEQMSQEAIDELRRRLTGRCEP